MTVPAESVLPPLPLPWSSRLSLVPPLATQHLVGDKILLPQSALEQLISAASTVESQRIPQPEHDPWAPAPNHGQFRDRETLLPYPMIVQITNKDTKKSAYAVPREFSAEDGVVSVSPFLLAALEISEDAAAAGEVVLEVAAASLSKGTRLRLRPLEAGYEDEAWEPILEQFMRDNFATMTEGTVLEVPRGPGRKGHWRFLVDEASPDGSICIIDTDVDLVIEPLSEEQALETLKRRQQRRSAGGKLKIEQATSGEIRPGEYHFYALEEWDRALPLVIELDEVDTEEGNDVDIFITTDRQHHKPRIQQYIWGDLGSSYPKRISISPGNVELVDAKQVSIGVRGWRDLELDDQGDGPSGDEYRRYTLRATQQQLSSPDTTMPDAPSDEAPSPDHKRCPNCKQWIPKRTFMLHESFCLRNNVSCPKCSAVFKRGTDKNHWHCPSCSTSGNTPAAQSKHNAVAHTPVSCTSCTYNASSLPDLAAHTTSTCPGMIILCRFCHLLVPQEGEGDGSVPDAEVILSGLTRHELHCGARTTECTLCSRRTRLRDLDLHLQSHELQRLNKPLPKICKNPNCSRTVGNEENAFGLCGTCFGPLYTPAYDPTDAGLHRRVERKLLQQLMAGCKKSWCRNRMCRTGRSNAGLGVEGQVIGLKDALPMVKEVLQQSSGGLELCVDEDAEKKRALAEALQVESIAEDGKKGGYAIEWCVKAVQESKGDASSARQWLTREAVREKER